MTGNIDDLPIHSIISNIGPALYQTANYLPKFLPPLSKTEYKAANKIEFIDNIKFENVTTTHSFLEVKSLFMNIPLNYAMNIILKRIYDDNELYTYISQKEMRKHFYFYVQKTRVLLLATKYTNNAMARQWGHFKDQ